MAIHMYAFCWMSTEFLFLVPPRPIYGLVLAKTKRSASETANVFIRFTINANYLKF